MSVSEITSTALATHSPISWDPIPPALGPGRQNFIPDDQVPGDIFDFAPNDMYPCDPATVKALASDIPDPVTQLITGPLASTHPATSSLHGDFKSGQSVLVRDFFFKQAFFTEWERATVVRKGHRQGLLGADIVYYEVQVPCGMQDGSTSYGTGEFYPVLDEIYDDSKPESEPRTPVWLVKERAVALHSCLVAERVQVGNEWIWEWTPATIDPHGESIRGDLQVIMHPASRASEKHGGGNCRMNTIHAIWAVPYTPQAIAALQRHGQRLAPEVIVLPPIADSQRSA